MRRVPHPFPLTHEEGALGYLGHAGLKGRGACQLPLRGRRVSCYSRKPLTQRRSATARLQLQGKRFPSLTELHTPRQRYGTARLCHHSTARPEDPNKRLHCPAPLMFPHDTVQMMQSLTRRADSRARLPQRAHGTCLPPIPAPAATEATGIAGRGASGGPLCSSPGQAGWCSGMDIWTYLYPHSTLH